MYIKEEYSVFYKDEQVGSYLVFNNKSVSYNVYTLTDENRDALKAAGLDKDKSGKKALPAFVKIMSDENRVSGTRKRKWRAGDITVLRVPEDADKFMIYRRRAEKGEEGYSEKDYSVPHKEGGKEIEGMSEWVSWYCFNKKDDGTYEAELDEAWYGGYGHNDGGTIRTEVPEEWLDLPYDEFLERAVGLSAAAHYGFTADELKEKKGLKEFFGF